VDEASGGVAGEALGKSQLRRGANSEPSQSAF